MIRDCRNVLLLTCSLALCTTTVRAQESHVERLQQAAVTCLDGIVSGVESLSLDADGRAPYLRSALVDSWKQQSIEVFRPDSSHSERIRHDLGYRVDDVRIVLSKAGSGLAERVAIVSLHYSLIDPAGRIVADDLCTAQNVDSLQIQAVAGLSDPRFPETDVTLADRSLLRRIVEPAVIIGAAVIGTYLFFNLRSKRTEGG